MYDWLSFFNLHVSLTTAGKLVRVTATRMKMIKGQMIRVRDQSCRERRDTMDPLLTTEIAAVSIKD